ncbi:hypothetical protein Q4488_16680 [Amphritea sp. 1_MG-2023]|uniref:hypothetical protein n=1 Tax=Amphritea sp. 1_MG-2023 TaxID=3062670 RepID=UPI0026E29413|nr:hypothetical protein [Amphritea sp. 1_MG-2023]MDO6565018.1 hypothetical protein [Amphritea sp. 1_MG-2023]
MNIFQGNYPIAMLVGVASVTIIAAPIVQADSVTARAYGLQGAAVSDQELASIRGRFVDGRSVTYFGVSMMTDWYLNSGKHLGMEMQVNFDLSRNRYQPTMTMYRRQDIGAQVSAGQGNESLGNVSSGGAFENVSGVVQNIQVAGDSNTVENGVGWNVSDRPAIQDTTGLVKVDNGATQTYLTADGVSTQVAAGANGVGYRLDVPNVGRVTQQINRSQLTGGHILQSTQLGSDLNQILNRIGLTVTLGPAAAGVRSQNFNRTMRSLRGL